MPTHEEHNMNADELLSEEESEKIKWGKQTGTVIQIVGIDDAVDVIVEERFDLDRWVNLHDGGEIKIDKHDSYYRGFSALDGEEQADAAMSIKAQFEKGATVVLGVNKGHEGELTLRNGDLTGRVRNVWVDEDGYPEGETDE